MNLLIIGGTGVISREIVNQAVKAGHKVTIFNRGSKKCEVPPEVTVINGDRNDKGDFKAKMASAAADTVIDMTCFDREAAEQTVEVFGNQVKQIIVTSSIAAYDRPYKSYPIREDEECLDTKREFTYGFQKAEAERYLVSRMGKVNAAITIIRPSLTFGPGAANFGILRQNRNVVRRIREGKPVVMIGEGVIPWSFTFVQDLAEGFLLSCGNEKTYNDCFHVTNTEIVMWEDLYKAVGEAVGREPKFVYVPTVLLREMLPSVCAHLNFEKVHFSVFSMDKFKKAVPEYEPKVRLVDGVKELVDWWEETDFPYDEERDRLEDEICRCYQEFRDKLVKLI
ncbi:NAD-dependent epimerase/dehydratase family protein [Clostridium sp. AM58-1XD]|uniref:NAD-dependent epimerase/dehydratase family protein n=1 Tax=Clostridium sp. AM58-1XD TaxID=2292307 RepID=UPI000E54CB5E|nr:NAD-dependent epimerase/dehydratase family protein [Clostridium sp. AM58-1XD]RGZ00649.1 NAD-dependent epimerase/dehydratase family protein [Clostridium sp. AM58-1XD]